ncbi:MAG: ATP-dependent DNA helicase RecG, partial [bacterium]|nr:ATP-dependent DNA helicase RecG [bacterium]
LTTIKAKVEKVSFKRTFRKRLTIVEAILSDESGTTKAIWFNQPYIVSTLKEGENYFFAGKFEFKNNNLSLQNPTFEESLGLAKSGKIIPIYNENSLINSRLIAKLVNQVINLTNHMSDDLPNVISQKNRLMNLDEAIRQIHQPDSMDLLERAQYRIAFEELFFLILAALISKKEMATLASQPIVFKLDLIKQFLSKLGFELTLTQKQSAWQIFKDIEKSHPMNRLLEGDVGSGKTVVALMSALLAIKAGYQVALMVPTEILANQHCKTSRKLLADFKIKVGLLTSSMKPKEKQAVEKNVAEGKIDLIIGTHSLISDKLKFKNLALVVIDEQHRFGVDQRNKLKAKANKMPHLLSMSATPIPRTLAIVIYGDLDLSVIRELPPGRKPIITKVITEDERSQTYTEIDQKIAEGKQVFIVCPLIEQSDKTGQKSVKAEHERLKNTVFSHRSTAMIHGKLNSGEKDQIMQQFVEGKIDILIATSLIEVGIDVENAAIMLIEGADRFGLAALHQLRGRVGRGKSQAYCYLFTETDNPAAIKRLASLERSNDGFRLSQIDLEMRGPGEIYGQRQHGFDLRMANLFDAKMITTVKQAAESFLKEQNMLKYKLVLSRLSQINTITNLN